MVLQKRERAICRLASNSCCNFSLTKKRGRAANKSRSRPFYCSSSLPDVAVAMASPKEWSKLQQSPNLAKLVNQTASLTIDRLGQLWKNSLMSNYLPNVFCHSIIFNLGNESLFLLYTPVKKVKLQIFDKKLHQMLTPQIMFVVICRQAFVISLIRICGGRRRGPQAPPSGGGGRCLERLSSLLFSSLSSLSPLRTKSIIIIV